MNWIKKNWKWLALAALIIIIFLAVKYKNRPVAVKVEEKPADSKPPVGKGPDTTASIQAEAGSK